MPRDSLVLIRAAISPEPSHQTIFWGASLRRIPPTASMVTLIPWKFFAARPLEAEKKDRRATRHRYRERAKRKV